MSEITFEPLGLRLKEQREKKGLSLVEIADRTKIPTSILESFEAGDSSKLPEPVFAKGFLRSYAVELGLNPQEILDEYKAANPQQTAPVAVPITAREGLEKRSKNRSALWLVLLLIVGIAAGGVYYLPQWLGSNTVAEEPSNTVSPGEATSSIIPSADSVNTPDPESVAIPDKPESTPAAANTGETQSKPDAKDQEAVKDKQPAGGGHVVKLVFSKETWMQIIIDEKKIQHGLYKPGDSKEWKAEESMDLRIGNAGGVKVLYNGEDLGKPGPEGRAVSLKFPPEENM